MGLDMYLEAKVYIGGEFHFIKEKQLTVSRKMKRFDKEDYKDADVIPTENLSSVIFNVGYWRKANQIHNWFVQNVQEGVDNCNDYFVSDEKLNDLEKVVKEVLADHTKAEELLPVCDGHYFGSTKYDEYYFEELENTLKIIELAREYVNKYGASIYYEASW